MNKDTKNPCTPGITKRWLTLEFSASAAWSLRCDPQYCKNSSLFVRGNFARHWTFVFLCSGILIVNFYAFNPCLETPSLWWHHFLHLKTNFCFSQRKSRPDIDLTLLRFEEFSCSQIPHHSSMMSSFFDMSRLKIPRTRRDHYRILKYLEESGSDNDSCNSFETAGRHPDEGY